MNVCIKALETISLLQQAAYMITNGGWCENVASSGFVRLKPLHVHPRGMVRHMALMNLAYTDLFSIPYTPPATVMTRHSKNFVAQGPSLTGLFL